MFEYIGWWLNYSFCCIWVTSWISILMCSYIHDLYIESFHFHFNIFLSWWSNMYSNWVDDIKLFIVMSIKTNKPHGKHCRKWESMVQLRRFSLYLIWQWWLNRRRRDRKLKIHMCVRIISRNINVEHRIIDIRYIV